MSIKQIRKIIADEIIAENMRQLKSGNITTASGDEVEDGSDAHISDLEKSLETLLRLRSQARRGSATRKTYSDAVARARAQLKAVKRRVEKRALGKV